jgi:Escherichia/Staphylococcus phage prohead protease
MTTTEKPTTGQVEERSAPETAELTIEGNRLHGLIPYGVESRDFGGWSEVIEPGALTHAEKRDLVATLNHDASRLLGRFDNTLKVEDRSDGLAWSVELGNGPTAQDVKDAVGRGDLNQSSWRMVVGRDRWDGTLRRIEEVRELKDVAVVTTGAYPAESTRVELRERPQEPTDPPKPPAAEGAKPKENEMEHDREKSGGLAVEDRSAVAEGATVEERILDAMAAVPKGESRDLTHATAEPVEPPELATFLWEKLRDQSIVLASGVPVVSTDRKKISWPTLKADMDVDFYGELDEIAKDDPELDDFELEPRAIKGLARGSSEAFEDSDPDLLQIVQNSLVTSMGLKFDAQALAGTAGSKAFDGMTKLAGQSLDMAGAEFENYDPIVAAMGLLAEAHVPGPYAVALHPRVATSLDRLRAVGAVAGETEPELVQLNVPLPRPEGLPPFWTSGQLPIASEKTSVLVYAPKMLLCVRRRDVTVEVDRSQEFDHDAVFVRGRARAILGTEYPEAIVQIKNVKSPEIKL